MSGWFNFAHKTRERSRRTNEPQINADNADHVRIGSGSDRVSCSSAFFCVSAGISFPIRIPILCTVSCVRPLIINSQLVYVVTFFTLFTLFSRVSGKHNSLPVKDLQPQIGPFSRILKKSVSVAVCAPIVSILWPDQGTNVLQTTHKRSLFRANCGRIGQ